MVQERRKSLRFRRAIFHQPQNQQGGAALLTLEEYVHKAHSSITTSARRLATFDGGFTLQMRYARQRRNVGTFLHLAAYTERERASVVPIVRGATDDAPLMTAPPPSGTEYMDGDLHLLISGNNVIVCASGLHERQFAQYCTIIFNQAELDAVAAMFELAPVANANKLELIENEGVKAITLDSSMFVASTENLARRSIRRSLNSGMLEVFRALFGQDADFKDLRAQENISAQLVIKFDSRRKGGELGQEKIDGLAKRLLDEPTDGFRIRTRGESSFGHDDISLQKAVNIPADGKTVQRDAAFSALSAYFLELKNEGHLDG